MHCDCSRARREARAEAFEEAAAVADACDFSQAAIDAADWSFATLLAIRYRALAATARAACAPKPLVRYTEAPEQERASGWPPSGATDRLSWISTNTSSGGTTVTGPSEPPGPWPDNPAEACK
jgi:hypothetical protein